MRSRPQSQPPAYKSRDPETKRRRYSLVMSVTSSHSITRNKLLSSRQKDRCRRLFTTSGPDASQGFIFLGAGGSSHLISCRSQDDMQTLKLSYILITIPRQRKFSSHLELSEHLSWVHKRGVFIQIHQATHEFRIRRNKLPISNPGWLGGRCKENLTWITIRYWKKISRLYIWWY